MIEVLRDVWRAVWLLLLGGLLVASPAAAAEIAAVGGSADQVQAAIDAAADGDSVLIPAGRHVWTKAVRLGTVQWGPAGPVTTGTKHLTLRGAGIDRTILVHQVPPHPSGTDDSLLVLHTAEGKPFRVTGMTLQGGEGEVGQLAAVRILGTSKQVRVDHVKFEHLPTRGLYLNGEIFGVIDHCQFLIRGWKQAIWIGHTAWGGHNYGDGSWASPLSPGTEKAIYIEDNLFRSAGASTASATVDSWMGGRWVFRHNRVENMTIGNHGTESSGRWRGCFSMEIYDNSFHRSDPMMWATMGGSRSGTCVLFNNTVTGTYRGFFTLDNYREWHAFQPWGACDGTGPYDLNDGVVYQTGKHSGADGAAVLQVAGANWEPDQWAGYSIHNLRRGDSCRIDSNTADSIRVVADSYTRSQGPFAWNAGDEFKIMKARVCLDGIGRSAGELLRGDKPPLPQAWPQQALEPLYEWDNTLNGQDANLSSRSILVREGREYYNNTRRPDYQPYAYPHPLIARFDGGESQPE